MSTCVYCDKLQAKAQLPAEDLVWEFEQSVALLGPWQYYTGYCVLVAKQHACDLNELAEPVRTVYLQELCQLSAAVARCFSPRKLNYELLGNQVPHLHWHLFPRYEHDPEKLAPVWLALDRAERDAQEKHRLQTGPSSRSEIAARLRAALRESGACA